MRLKKLSQFLDNSWKERFRCSFCFFFFVSFSCETGPVYMEKPVPARRITLPAESTLARKSWPLCSSQERSRMLWLSRLDRIDPAGRAKREFKLHVYGKRQTVRFKLRISQNRKWADENCSEQFLWIKKMPETTNVGVEIMNSKRQVKGKLGHVVQLRVCRLTWTWSLTSLKYLYGGKLARLGVVTVPS